jgi:hypothetical protein
MNKLTKLYYNIETKFKKQSFKILYTSINLNLGILA